MPTSINLKLWPTLLLTAVAAFSACRGTQTASKSQPAQQQRGEESKQAARQAAPEVEIYADEAMLRKPYAILGGSVRNVGTERLADLVLELELKRRADGSTERREVPVQPSELAPGAEAKYSLKVLSDEWASSRVVRLRSGARAQDVAYKILPGARRPPERMPDGKEIIVKAPRKPGGAGEEFINTPDTAVSVP